MARVESEGGMLTLALEEGERLRITAGSHVLLVSRGSDGNLTTTLRSGSAAAEGAAVPAPEQAPLGIGAPAADPPVVDSSAALSAPDAIREIMLVFEQANVALRRARRQHAADSPDQASALEGVKAGAMDQVVDLCHRYTQARSAAAPSGEAAEE